eukprot:GFUD01041727.1.p1 GENE.GFUD01041727.1~~GFUD01041727.1.p1  ORF type:complete len:108 (+),score=19.99 GFUD01041727.1:155-478(+)
MHPIIVSSIQPNNLNVDPNPEKQEQSSKAHEQRGDSSDHHLLHDLPGELGGCHLVHKEPGSEEESNPHQDKGEVGEDRRVDGGDISGQGGDISNSHDDDLVGSCLLL